MNEKYTELLERMSLDEKIKLCEGADFWHTRAFPKYDIPAVMMCDGPHGLRRQSVSADNLGINESVPAVCFPTAVLSACSFDTELLSKIGQAIGEEARANGVSLVLGPGLNIKRDPRCGRNFEYFSEDPYLSGKLAAAYVKGQQSTGVGSCLKHYCANSQEYKRYRSDSILDERTLREIYLRGFEIAAKEGKPAAIMSSYNRVNGEHVGDSKRLLDGILREDWGWQGLVVTDWGAMNDRVKGFEAGCDLLMPGGTGYGQRKVKKAVQEGRLSEKDVDKCVRNVLDFVENARKTAQTPCDMSKHHELARLAAEQSAVLLKNGGALPLRGKACLIGHMAQEMRYQGTGSSHINPYSLKTPCELLDWDYAPGCTADGYTNDKLIAEAVELAKSVTTPVVFAGLTEIYESEGFDREHMRLPDGHVRLIEAVAEANPNTVVVLLCGSAVEMPWADKVNAILYMGLPGEAGAEATVRLLTGKANPSGRLAETWLMSNEDAVTSEVFGSVDAEYREGVFVGYRYTDSANVPVRYPFGHGLSYTQFAYSDFSFDGKTASVTVKNIGEVAGAHSVLLFVSPPVGGIFRPVRELKGFAKAFLKPGESKKVEIEVDDRAFAVWNGGWVIPAGEYTLRIGDLEVKYMPENSVELATPEELRGSWYETLSGKPPVEDWYRLLGRRVEPEEKPFDLDSSLAELAPHSFLARKLMRVVEIFIGLTNGGADPLNPAYKMMLSCSVDCAVRSLSMCGGLPLRMLRKLVNSANRGGKNGL